jgi:3-hydroxybutyryl-CoA dehydratase
MHGNILNGFISYFIGERLPTKNLIIHLQKNHFKNPVYLNDKLSFNSEIIIISESVRTIEFKYTFKNIDAKIVATGNIQIGLLI